MRIVKPVKIRPDIHKHPAPERACGICAIACAANKSFTVVGNLAIKHLWKGIHPRYWYTNYYEQRKLARLVGLSLGKYSLASSIKEIPNFAIVSIKTKVNTNHLIVVKNGFVYDNLETNKVLLSTYASKYIKYINHYMKIKQ